MMNIIIIVAKFIYLTTAPMATMNLIIFLCIWETFLVHVHALPCPCSFNAKSNPYIQNFKVSPILTRVLSAEGLTL